MLHIKELLAKHLKQSGLAKNVEISLVMEEFNRLVKDNFGELFLKKIKPLYIKDRILVVACLSTVFSQEFRFYKQKIINQLNLKFKKEVIKDIRFTL